MSVRCPVAMLDRAVQDTSWSWLTAVSPLVCFQWWGLCPRGTSDFSAAILQDRDPCEHFPERHQNQCGRPRLTTGDGVVHGELPDRLVTAVGVRVNGEREPEAHAPPPRGRGNNPDLGEDRSPVTPHRGR